MSRPGRRRMAAIVVASLLALVAIPQLAAAQEPSNGRIIFVSNRAGGDDIYSIRPDSQGTRLRLDGETALADPIETDPFARFGFGPSSSDGLLFTQGQGGGNSQVRGIFDEVAVDYTRKAATNRQGVPLFGGFEIVYVSDRDGDDELRFTSVLDQLDPRQFRAAADAAAAISSRPIRIQRGEKITDNSDSDRDPTVGRFGSRIAFTSDRTGNDDIWTKPGRNPKQLTDDPAADYQPAYSFDGRQIAFVSERDGNPEIYLMDAKGEGLQRLTNDPAADTEPTFSPDGTKIAFGSDRSGNPEIYRMKVDGSAQRNVTRTPDAADISPHWGTQLGPFDCFVERQFTRVRGTADADNLIGDGGRQIIRSFGGRDTARGRGSQDCVFGEDEGDLLFGNAGQDKLVGAGGFDRLHGGRGRDLLDGGSSPDKLRGGKKSDALVGGRGNDRLDGGPGSDLLLGEAGDDQLLGGDGSDVIFAGLGRDRVSCGGGKDAVFTTRRRRGEYRGGSCEFVIGFGNGRQLREIGLSFRQFFEIGGNLPRVVGGR